MYVLRSTLIAAALAATTWAGIQLSAKPETLPLPDTAKATKRTLPFANDPGAFLHIKKAEGDVSVNFRKTGQNDFQSIRQTRDAVQISNVTNGTLTSTIIWNDGRTEQFSGNYHPEKGHAENLQRTVLMALPAPVRNALLAEKASMAKKTLAACVSTCAK